MINLFNQNHIKTFFKKNPILYKTLLRLYILKSFSLVPRSKKRLEKEAFFFWNRPKANDLQYEKALSHHCGTRLWDKKKFTQYGKSHYVMYIKALIYNKLSKRNSGNLNAIVNNKLDIDIVDWGPGGGSLMLAFAKNIKGTYYGVDIADENLEECYLRADEAGIKNFQGILINITNPEKVYSKIKKCNLFICTAVFPHLPHKEYAERITKIASNLLEKDGIGIIHVLLTEKKRIFHIGSYASQVHTNTVFTYEEYIQILKKYNLDVLYVTRDKIATYSYFHVVKA